MSQPNVPEVAPPDLPGYRFIKPIGAGGNAQVFLYEQNLPSRKVAVKVLNESALSEGARRRFTAEANVTAGLAHRHIVQVFEARVTEDGRPYLVMPYYPRPNLSVRASRASFSVGEVLRIGIQIGGAVETSHHGGVLHRDIKPQNILTDSYGEPALTDFGIATAKGGEGPEGLSVPWSPPEILFGTSPGDERADVYSLGATLWHLLVGRSPFEAPGDNGALALIGRIKSDPPPRTGRADVPESLERLLRQAMAKDPAARPQTAMELIRGLQSVEQELRLPVTQPILPAGGPGDTTRRETISSQVPGDETTFRREADGHVRPGTDSIRAGSQPWAQQDQQPWGGLQDTASAHGPRSDGAWPAWTPPVYSDDPARAQAQQAGLHVPARLQEPWSPASDQGRHGKGRSRRMTILAVGVVVLAAVAVVAVPRLSGGGKNAALASADGRTTQTASGQYSPRPAPATSAAAATKEAGQSTQSPPPGPATQPADSPETHAAPSVARTGVRATPPGQGNPNTGPSSQSPSHEPIVTPVVNATANGTTVAYTWSAQSDGLTETLQVCIAGACTSYTVPAAGGYSGSATRTYGNSETETITAHLTDTAGQSSGTATASATTAAALVTVTPPPPAAVTVTEGPHVTGSTASGGSCASSTNCVAFNVSASNFTANAVLNYTCSLNGSQWFSGDVIVGGTAKADASGAASFETRCIALPNGKSTVTIQVSDGTHAASSSVSI